MSSVSLIFNASMRTTFFSLMPVNCLITKAATMSAPHTSGSPGLEPGLPPARRHGHNQSKSWADAGPDHADQFATDSRGASDEDCFGADQHGLDVQTRRRGGAPVP